MKTFNCEQADEIFDKVYKKYRKPVSYYAYNFLGNKEEARDISADIFVDVWILRESFNSAEKMKSFVMTCARNACLNRLKLIKRRKSRLNDVMQCYYMTGTVDIIEVLTESREAELVRVIKSLDMKYQECIWLFYFEKMTCTKIARRMNLSERNVWFFLVKGRSMIKSALSLNSN
jgi:RNA polymerase sigma factor (sigma-70 family)